MTDKCNVARDKSHKCLQCSKKITTDDYWVQTQDGLKYHYICYVDLQGSPILHAERVKGIKIGLKAGAELASEYAETGMGREVPKLQVVVASRIAEKIRSINADELAKGADK